MIQVGSSASHPNQEFGETGWRQYKEKQDEKVEQKKRLNTASIWVYARKIMAREWARALGKKSSRESLIEIEAREYKRRK